jgi:hypothetical protein
MSACSPGSSAFLPVVRTIPCFLQGMSNQEGRKHMARQTSKGDPTFIDNVMGDGIVLYACGPLPPPFAA